MIRQARSLISLLSADSSPHSFLRRYSVFSTRSDISADFSSPPRDDESRKGSGFNPMEFVRHVVEDDNNYRGGGFTNFRQLPRFNLEQEVDIVNIKLMRNNTFVTVTNSKGDKKAGASAGCLSDMKGGPKLSRYAAEATAERVGRMCRDLASNDKLKSVVIRVKGFAPFNKKKQAIMRWKDGFSGNQGSSVNGGPQIVYIEDTTRKAHNGCRLKKKRRI